MSNAVGPVRTGCSDRSCDGSRCGEHDSEKLKAAYLGSPIGDGFRAELKRARKLTRANALKKAADVAVAASMLLAGRGSAGVS